MMNLYYAPATSEFEEFDSKFIVKNLTVCRKNREYLNKRDYIWHLATLGKFRKIMIFSQDNRIAHVSRVITRCYKFPFLPKNSAEIGPCTTKPDFRGQGIYTKVLNYIRCEGGSKDYYMLVADENIASIKGMEKAGFKKIGTVKKRLGQWVIAK